MTALTKSGRRYFMGLPGATAPPAGTPLQFVVATPVELVSQIVARIAAGQAETYQDSEVGNIRPYVSGGGGDELAILSVPPTLSGVAPDELLLLAYNLVVNNQGKTEGNILWKSTVPFLWQLSQDGLVVAGAGWPNPSAFAGKYTADDFVPGGGTYTARGRIDAATVGGGVQPSQSYTLRMAKADTPSVATEFVITPYLSAAPVPIPVQHSTSTNEGGGGNSTYFGGVGDSVPGVTDPDGQASDNGLVDPQTEA